MKNYTKAELTTLLNREDFPRAASYDPVWMLENLMGPFSSYSNREREQAIHQACPHGFTK